MEHYVTFFDSLFIPNGIALQASMDRHLKNYTLWILCVDDACFSALKKLDLPNANLLQLSALETEELLKVKQIRTRVEYIWSLAPFAIRTVFQIDSNVRRVTYIDADIWFMRAPEPIFKELENSGKEVLITDHGYAPEYDLSAYCGQYNVQFMPFNRTGENVRKWWEERCMENCSFSTEGGQFGDQKYLDDWPERFPGEVHVLANKELTLAPWNATRFPYSSGIFWHFHGLRIAKIFPDLLVHYGNFPLPATTRQFVYTPYLNDLKDALARLKNEGVCVNPQIKPLTFKEQYREKKRGIREQLWKFNLGIMKRILNKS
jgi:hypothetical protein